MHTRICLRVVTPVLLKPVPSTGLHGGCPAEPHVAWHACGSGPASGHDRSSRLGLRTAVAAILCLMGPIPAAPLRRSRFGGSVAFRTLLAGWAAARLSGAGSTARSCPSTIRNMSRRRRVLRRSDQSTAHPASSLTGLSRWINAREACMRDLKLQQPGKQANPTAPLCSWQQQPLRTIDPTISIHWVAVQQVVATV